MAKKIYPVASFEPCDNEVSLAFDLFARISLLAPLPAKTKENMEKCPGAIRLRRFRKDDLICRQGEEDCTAFYILKRDDLDVLKNYPAQRAAEITAEQGRLQAKRKELEAALAKAQSEARPKDVDKLQKQIADLREKLSGLELELARLPGFKVTVQRLPASQSPGTPADPAAIVYLGGVSSAAVPADGWLQRLKRKLAGVLPKPSDRDPLNIPFDGPTEINSRSRQASLHEGELFGEMACLNRAPRSATVAAARECYILEMLSNILTEIDKDPRYQEERNRTYQERVLNGHLRDLSIFRDLTDAEFARVLGAIRGQVELKSFASGELICDEHDRPDHVYLVRSGLVQVKKNVTSLLRVADVVSWRDLCAALRETGPAAQVWRLLPDSVGKLMAAAADPDQITPGDRLEIVYGLNEVIKGRQLASLPEYQDVIVQANLHDKVRAAVTFQSHAVFDPKEIEDVIKTASLRIPKQTAPVKVQEWTELDRRRLNRLLLEEVLPRCLKPLPHHGGPETVLVYCSRGESIGEIGVCKRQPRSATCIAFGQPRGPKQEELSRVEMVLIPGEVFLRLMDEYPAIRASVEAEIARREVLTTKRMDESRTGASGSSVPKELDRLGLIQGQRLMLIDMERCTLCGECVRGCVDSHADGRSRLFLAGHRFDKYMVPITCRSCLDPVCMIECPVRSIQRGDNQEIIIKDWCIGCQKCAKNCPYDAIKMHDLPGPEPAEKDAGAPFRIRDEIAVVCDLCSTLADKTPRCVYACPHEAAMRINARVELPTL